MRPSEALNLYRSAIRAAVERHRARNPRVFGSVVHQRDREGSDLDILVDPTEETSLFDLGAIRMELEELLGVEVDVLTPNSLPDRWRQQVLEEARPL